MRRFLKYANLLLLAGLLVLSSCASHPKKGQSLVPEIITTGHVTRKFNLQLDFGKNHFSGMLIARRMDSGEVRLLFTTHFGLSVFDFSLHPDSMVVNSIVEPMRKKKVLNLLEKDFRLIFEPSENVRIKEKNSIFEKRKSGRGITKAVITLSEFTNDEPQRVHIRHPWIKLNIQLDVINFEL